MRTPQHEITTPAPLLRPDGTLTDAGWARQPLLDCNLENLRFYRLRFLQWLRVKRWDYYAVFTPTHFFSFTISHVGYLGSIFAYTVDFTTWTHQEETLTVPLGRGVVLPRNSTEGESLFDNGRVRLRFCAASGKRQVEVHWDGFGGQALNAEMTLALAPQHESVVNIIPIGSKRFYYTRKVHCMPAAGWVECGGQRHTLHSERNLGILDWGRGVWAYNAFWIWGSVNTFLPDGRTLGLNLGAGIGDMRPATDCALILNGRVHKLGVVHYDYDPQDFTRPWQIHDDDGRLELTFTPHLDRAAATDLKLLYSRVHQLFGHYNGHVLSDDGEKISLRQQIGFIEDHRARW